MPTPKSNTKVVTGIVRLSYANVWEPASINGSNPKYSVSLIIPKSDTKTIAAINAAVDAAIKDGVAKFGGKVPPKGALKLPLRDGYDLQNGLREEMLSRGIRKGVATVLTQVEVDPQDPAFQNPTKPIGAFMTKEEADALVRERDYQVVEDAGRGYRRVVASPRPRAIVEIESIRDMMDAGLVVVACGGGGIPVYPTQGHHLKGAAAVIDKDFAASCLAQQLDADFLIILTAVEKVAIRFCKPDVEWLSSLTPEKAREYMAAGEFAPGSMLSKVQAAVEFAESKPGRSSLITLLEKARDGVAGKTGTRIEG